MRKIYLSILVVIESVVLLYIVYRVYLHYYVKTNVLGDMTNVIRIRKDDLIFPDNTSLKYYYEPAPGYSEEYTSPWRVDLNKVRYTINSDSLYERFDYQVDKSRSTFRIITLGDSFTSGLFINTAENYSEKLEDFLNAISCSKISHFDVINLGVAGYDIQDSVERFKNRGQKYDPDLVLWFLKDDDFEEIREIVNKRADEIFNAVSEDLQREYRSSWGKPTELAIQEFHDNYGMDKIINQQSEFFSHFSDYYKGNLVLFTLTTTQARYKQLLQYYAQIRPNTYYFDDIPDIYKRGETFPDTHPNSAGHTTIANSLYKYLQSDNFFTCK